MSGLANMSGTWDPCELTLSAKYDMDAYMATLFGGEVWDLCWAFDQAES